MRNRPERRFSPRPESLGARQLPSGLPVGPAPEVGAAPVQPYPDPGDPLTEPLDRSQVGVDVDIDALGIPRDRTSEADGVTIPAVPYPTGDYPRSDGVIYV